MTATSPARHATREELEAGLGQVREAPADEGSLELIVRRPEVDAREVLETGVLDIEHGLVGDSWRVRGSSRTADGRAHPDMQLNIMSARAIALIAGDCRWWPLAGDQLFVDLDLSEANLPPGTQLALGSATVEVTDQPHTGCAKFVRRFGLDAMKFVNSPAGRSLRLRGLNARVVNGGTITVGDVVRRMPALTGRRSREAVVVTSATRRVTLGRVSPGKGSRQRVRGGESNVR